MLSLDAKSENEAASRDQVGQHANRFSSVVWATYEASSRGHPGGGVFLKSDRRNSFHQLFESVDDAPLQVTQRSYILNTKARESSGCLPVWRLNLAVSNKAVETLPRAF